MNFCDLAYKIIQGTIKMAGIQIARKNIKTQIVSSNKL